MNVIRRTEAPATAESRSPGAALVMRWTLVIVTALFLTAGTSVAQEKKPKKPPVTEATFRIWHVLSTKGVKPRVPKPLAKFSKNLAKIGTSHKVVGKPLTVTLKVDKKLPLKLPKNLRPGLETGSLLLAKDGSVTVTLRPLKPKNQKEVLRLRSRAFPFFLIDERRFRVGDELYLLILEKVPTPPRK